MDFKYDNNNTVRVRFHYESENQDGYQESAGRALSNINGKKIFTYCEIGVKDPNEGYRGIAGDFVVRNPKDIFNKSLGRKLALTRAISQIKDKGLRASIWESFLNSHRRT